MPDFAEKTANWAAKRTTLWILAILGVAAALRSLMLTKESLWLDELASWFFAGRDLATALRAEPANPPLYYVLLHFWMRAFGSTEAAMRSLSVLPSVATVGLLYVMAKRWYRVEVALAAAGYCAISSFQISYAQEARVHALLAFLILAASFELWNALNAADRRSRTTHYVVYAFLCAVTLYSHFMAVFFLASHGIYVLLRRPKQLAWVATALVAALAAFSPWLLVMVGAAMEGGQHRRYLLLKLPQTYFSLIFGDTLIPLDEQAVRNVAAVLSGNWHILAAALFSVGTLLWRARPALNERKEETLFALNLCVTPVVLAFLVSFRIMVFDERYMLSASPFLYLILSLGALQILKTRDPMRRRIGEIASRGALAVFVMLLLASLSNYYFNPRYGKEQWREAVAYMDERSGRDGAQAVVFDPDYLYFCYDYYTKQGLKAVRVTPHLAASIARDPGEFLGMLNGVERVWLVRSHEYGDAVLQAITTQFEERSVRFFPKGKGIELRLFERRPGS